MSNHVKEIWTYCDINDLPRELRYQKALAVREFCHASGKEFDPSLMDRVIVTDLGERSDSAWGQRYEILNESEDFPATPTQLLNRLRKGQKLTFDEMQQLHESYNESTIRQAKRDGERRRKNND